MFGLFSILPVIVYLITLAIIAFVIYLLWKLVLGVERIGDVLEKNNNKN